MTTKTTPRRLYARPRDGGPRGEPDDLYVKASQVTYRLSHAKIKRSDYRNGESQAARVVLQIARAKLEETIRERLAKEVK